jgi:hypothetical protein
MSTVQEQLDQEMPQKPVGVLDIMNLPPGAAALTCTGRTYKKAAEHLFTLQQRRVVVLRQYEAQLKEMAPIVEELIRCHSTIDDIIGELSNRNPNTQNNA